MLNERTADTAVISWPEEPATVPAASALRQLADFLERFPGIPQLYVTLSGTRRASVQLSTHTAEPRERCLAVARIAEAMGTDTHLELLGSGQSFETDVTVGNIEVLVYAPITDLVRDNVAGEA
ncbi:hypothetical protein [Streptomyces sp. 7N604]|uniref:hypothetical protein n=1 Tax=Streptomyces sp. 7N604 TaxID=3457415 RepID=UPI003FD0B876